MDAFLWKKKKKALHSRFKKLKGQDASKEPQQTCSRSISAVFVSSSLCCTCIMNAKMRLQMHNEDDFIYPISPPFNKHLQKQPNAGEELWENRQPSLQACNLASIDSALYIPHGHTHMQTETSKQPPKIASTHADHRKSEIIAYQISLSRVWRSSHSQRGRRGEIIAYQEKWTRNELEKNGGDCASQKAFKFCQILIKTSYKCESLPRQI